MRIYNEVVLQWDDNTQQFNTIYEDFEEYTGPVAMAQGLPPNATPISGEDTIADTIKITSGYFTDGDGTLTGTQIHTASLSTSNKSYYFNVTQVDPSSSLAESQFSVTFAHYAGSGSDQHGDSVDNAANIIGETQAIYKQFSSILLHEDEQPIGFKISGGETVKPVNSVNSLGVIDDYVYALVANREKFKDRVNKKSWTLILSGSTSSYRSGSEISLTDDSNISHSIATPAGPRYNIVSGALGLVHTEHTDKTYGWFYPERGIMLFSGAELSASIPGAPTFLSQSSVSSLTLTASISCSATSKIFSGSSADMDFSVISIGGHTGLKHGDYISIESGSGAGHYQQVVMVSGSTIFNPGGTGCAANAFTGSNPWGGNTFKESVGVLPSFPWNITASFNSDGDGVDRQTIFKSGSNGFAPNLDSTGNSFNALKFANCMRNVRSDNVLRLRSEEDATEENYFCRIKAQDYNFSSNPTFTTGSFNKVRHISMRGNPQVFITGIGLYNSTGHLLAIAELSSPLRKNFASEATIKIKLTY
jgi:hypothetical protein